VSLSEDAYGQPDGRLSSRTKWQFGRQSLAEAARWRPDLIICVHLALGPVGWLLAVLGRRPFWIVVHGIEAWVPLPLAKRFALRRADCVIVTSKYNYNRVKARQRVSPDRIKSLPCALDETLRTTPPASEGPHRSLAPSERVVLTVARMDACEQYKGHDVILHALPQVLSRVPNVKYVVVGEGSDRTRIEALAGSLGLRSTVLFTGRVSDAQLAALYERSDVFALPAKASVNDHEAKGEGFGIVFLEAMAFGKPVIGPDEGAPAEIIQHERQGLLVSPENPAALADALVALLTDPARAREMGQAGRECVRENYSFTSFRNNLSGLLSTSCEFSR